MSSATNDLMLHRYCDSNWGGCPINRKSVTGFCQMLGPSLIFWQSKKQHVTSRIQVSFDSPTPLFSDNQATIDIAQNPIYHSRTKHIKIDCHFVKKNFNMGLFHHKNFF